MRTHSRKTWPLFLADAVLALLGLFVFHGTAASVILFVCFFAVIGTAIYGLAGEKPNDGLGGIGGGTSF
jgi:4-amino-4-deoxy-L-arabinose transferase-like glycosyltransferase